jgi:hypothetical protein
MERVATSGSIELRREAAKQLSQIPGVYQLLSTRTRSQLTGTALVSPGVVDYALSRLRSHGQSSGLPAVIGYELRIAWWSAVAILVWFGGQLLIEASRHRPWNGLTITSVILAAAFLVAWSPTRRRAAPGFAWVGAALIAGIAVLAALAGLTALISAVIYAAKAKFTNAIVLAVTAYICTWPLVMVSCLLASSPRSILDWLLPHRRLAQIVAEQIHWQGVPRRLLPIGKLAVAGIVVAAIWAIASHVPLPKIPKHQVSGIRYAIGFGIALVVFLAFVAVLRWRRYSSAQRLRRYLAGQSIDARDVLSLLRQAGTRNDCVRLLTDLRNCPPDNLQSAAGVFRDLSRSLSHVEDFVPVDTTKQIPMAIWSVGPEFSTPGFTQWLIDYDLQYPGRLSWLARWHQDDIVEAFSRIEDAWREAGRE